jgi:hypothetical protein
VDVGVEVIALAGVVSYCPHILGGRFVCSLRFRDIHNELALFDLPCLRINGMVLCKKFSGREQCYDNTILTSVHV